MHRQITHTHIELVSVNKLYTHTHTNGFVLQVVCERVQLASTTLSASLFPVVYRSVYILVYKVQELEMIRNATHICI